MLDYSLNLAYVGADSSTVASANADGFKVESAPVGTYELLLNEKDPSTDALTKPQVRQAIGYAIDRPALAQLVAPGGYAKADDPTKAKALLAAAGYPNGLTLNVALVTARTQDQTMFEGLAQELSAAGITLNPVTFTSPSSITQNAGYLLTMIGGPLQAQYQAWLAPTAASDTWGTDPTLVSLYTKGLYAKTPTADWTKLVEYEAKQAYYVTICSVSGIWYVAHTITGVNVTAPRIGAALISEISPAS